MSTPPGPESASGASSPPTHSLFDIPGSEISDELPPPPTFDFTNSAPEEDWGASEAEQEPPKSDPK